jgi:hypothetical protein
MPKEEIDVKGPEVGDNAVYIYVSSKDFPFRQCLQVTKETLNSLANLTAQEDPSGLGGHLKKVGEQNALVMQAFREIRIRSIARYAVIFAGCDVLVCLCSANRLPKPIASAVKSVINVDKVTEVFNIPWMVHDFEAEDVVFNFNTGYVTSSDKFATVTLGSESLKKMLQDSVQDLFEKMSKEMAVMYGPAEGLVDDRVSVGH